MKTRLHAAKQPCRTRIVQAGWTNIAVLKKVCKGWRARLKILRGSLKRYQAVKHLRMSTRYG